MCPERTDPEQPQRQTPSWREERGSGASRDLSGPHRQDFIPQVVPDRRAGTRAFWVEGTEGLAKWLEELPLVARPSQAPCPEPGDQSPVSPHPWAFGLRTCSQLWGLPAHNSLRRRLARAGHWARETRGLCVGLAKLVPAWRARRWGLPGQSAHRWFMSTSSLGI